MNERIKKKNWWENEKPTELENEKTIDGVNEKKWSDARMKNEWMKKRLHERMKISTGGVNEENGGMREKKNDWMRKWKTIECVNEKSTEWVNEKWFNEWRMNQ